MSAKVDEKYELIRRYVSGKLAEWSAEGNETFRAHNWLNCAAA